MSAFDPETLLSTEVEGANSTEVIPVPEYEAVAAMVKPGSISAKQIHNAEKNITSTIVNMDWEIDDEEARKVTGREHPTVRQSFFLDLDSNGRISTEEGKNVGLGRVRAAVGKNDGPFILRDLEGCMARVRVKHRLAEIGGMETTVAEVRGVLPLEAEG